MFLTVCLLSFRLVNRVETSERCSPKNGQPHGQRTNSPRGCQVHVAIASSFSTNQIIKPTEVLLRKFFVRYGTLLDVQVNYYTSGNAVSVSTS